MRKKKKPKLKITAIIGPLGLLFGMCIYLVAINKKSDDRMRSHLAKACSDDCPDAKTREDAIACIQSKQSNAHPLSTHCLEVYQGQKKTALPL